MSNRSYATTRRCGGIPRGGYVGLVGPDVLHDLPYRLALLEGG